MASYKMERTDSADKSENKENEILARIEAEHLKGRKSRQVPGIKATRFHIIESWDGTYQSVIAMEYHNTDVAIFTTDYVVLNTGCWYTQTTKERMNWALSLAGIGDRISQYKKVWYFGTHQYFDGIKLEYNTGSVLSNPTVKSALTEVKPKTMKAIFENIKSEDLTRMLLKHNLASRDITYKLIDRYVKNLSHKISVGTLDIENFGGSLNTAYREETLYFEDIKELVDILLAKNEHMNIIYSALIFAGYPQPEYFIGYSDTNRLQSITRFKEIILRAVRAFFTKRLVTQLISSEILTPEQDRIRDVAIVALDSEMQEIES